jgi:uncharacterized membrane protein YhaH (DUF805 family)
MHWMILPLRRYADFRSRSRRMEYWAFVLFLFLLFAITATLDTWLPTGGRTLTAITTAPGLWAYSQATDAGWITRIASIAMILPSLAVAVRRLHDIGRSGFWLLVSFVPLLGAILLLVFFLTDSQRGANRWGPDPKPVADRPPLG